MLSPLRTPQMVIFYLVGAVSGFLLGFLSTSYSALVPVVVRPYNNTSGGDVRARLPDQQSLVTSIHMGVDLVDDIIVQSGRKPNNLSIDAAKHADDDHTVAVDLYKTVRVLVWVMTHPDNLEKKAVHVRNTWGKRANMLLFASDYYNETFPTMNITVEHGRAHLTAKTMAAFDYIYKHYINEYDWFMKADDDTYVIMENLRYFLSKEDTNEPYFFGHWFKNKSPQGYYSGGGGYVISRKALEIFGNRAEAVCSKDLGAEDVAFGRCMHALGVQTKTSLDSLGRSRFHCFTPPRFLRGRFPGWYYGYDKYNASHRGQDAMSDYAITFHYINIDTMYDLEYYVYHLRPFGIRSGLQELNAQS